MSAPRSLQQTLQHARRERPEALPAGFAAGVMEKLRRPSPPAFTRLEAFAIGGAAVLTASFISLLASPRNEAAPPPLSVFSEPAGSSPFVTP